MRPGMRLNNGACVIAVRKQERNPGNQPGGIVLAVRDDEWHPYATWSFNEDGSTYWGHYWGVNELVEAIADFRHRS